MPPEFDATCSSPISSKPKAVEQGDKECSLAFQLESDLLDDRRKSPFTYCQEVQQMGHAEKIFHSGFSSA